MRKSGENFRTRSSARWYRLWLDSLRGVREGKPAIQRRRTSAGAINQHRRAGRAQAPPVKEAGGTAQAVTGAIILLLDAGMLALACRPVHGRCPSGFTTIALVSVGSTHGAASARVIRWRISAPGSQSTFAAGNRVLDILDEQPAVREVTDGRDIVFCGADARRVAFGYRDSRF